MNACVDTKIRIPVEIYEKLMGLKSKGHVKSINSFTIQSLERNIARFEKNKKGV